MLETLKKRATDFVLKTKDLFTPSESQVYVKDLRKVMTYEGRKCKYLKNYDQIVKSGEIKVNKDMHGNPVLDKDKNPTYRLVYGKKDKDGQPSFKLTKVTEIDGKSYFTIDFLVNPKDVKHYDGYYKPFGFSKIDLEEHIPVFEAKKTNDLQCPFQLTHSSVLTKEVKNEKGKVQEVVDEKGRNGKLLYTSDHKKLSTSFSEIRDQNNNLELDKSLISVPIVFATSLAKVCAKWLTYLPMKLGENLISRQNPIAKSLGYLLFTPAAAVKNSVNMGATILKAPILLFVASEKKYGDAYLTMWKHQLKECWQETKNDYPVIKDGERLKPEQKDCEIAGTWDELNAKRPDKSLKKNLQNEGNEQIAVVVNQKSNTPHTDEENRRRDPSKNTKTSSPSR